MGLWAKSWVASAGCHLQAIWTLAAAVVQVLLLSSHTADPPPPELGMAGYGDGEQWGMSSSWQGG